MLSLSAHTVSAQAKKTARGRARRERERERERRRNTHAMSYTWASVESELNKPRMPCFEAE